MARQMAALEAMKADIMSKLDVAPQWETDTERVNSNDSSFTELDWDYLGIDSTAVVNLAEAIKNNTNLKSLSVSGNNLVDEDIIVLCKAIRRNKQLPIEDLNLSFNAVTKESAPALEKLYLRPGLSIQLFGTDIEKEVEQDVCLRQTKRSTKESKKAKKRRVSGSKTSRRKTSSSKTLAPPVERARTEQNIDIVDDDELQELEERVKELQENEQDYILRIDDLEGKLINLMRNKTDHSIKSSSSLFSKFKRSMTLEKKNVVITRKLAEIGGSGAGVYSCLIDGWKCAMKELDTSHMSQYTIDGFLGEIQLLEFLPQHDNISRYLFHEISGSRIRLFMTQYHGSLGSFIQNRGPDKPFQPIQIWRLCLDIIKGIEFLHGHGIIHRDLKSDNIFILMNEKGEILKCAIGDFDTAKQVNSKSEQAKTVLGTPAWMAPEVMDAKELGSYSFSCDIYSFGMILYELLTMKMPYCGMNPMRIPMMVLQGQKPQPPELDESYNALVELYDSCVEFKPKSRPSVKTVKSTIANNLIK